MSFLDLPCDKKKANNIINLDTSDDESNEDLPPDKKAPLQSPAKENIQRRQLSLFSWSKANSKSLKHDKCKTNVEDFCRSKSSAIQISDDSSEVDEQSPDHKKLKLAYEVDTDISEDEVEAKISKDELEANISEDELEANISEDEFEAKIPEDQLEANVSEESTKNVPRVQLHYTTKVEGISVEMPVRPYPCQLQLMESVIKGCNTKQNCLIESPTGSGKTLALLCGTLAWQTDYKKKADAEAARAALLEATNAAIQQPDECKVVDEMSFDGIDPSEWESDDIKDFGKKPASKKMPKIYYGSRTHRQIEQVVDELKRTVYRDAKMTLLSSREHSCIQQTKRSKTELCNELLDPTKKRGCPYYNEKNKFALGTHNNLKLHGVESPWQIEDLVSVAQESDLCAYFAARALIQDADIVFCPYNYVIDPRIRESLNLDLSNAIIILDEGHNIEDICRESGSVSVPICALQTIIIDCQNVVVNAKSAKMSHQTTWISVVWDYCERLQKLIETTPLAPKKGAFDAPTSAQWTGNELLEIFRMNNINESVTSNFNVGVRDVINQFKISKENSRYSAKPTFTLNADSVRKLEEILMGICMVQSPAHAPDYRVVIKMVNVGFKREKSLEFMCMNPGVVFRPLCTLARTVIVASGTLSPTSSYAGELGVEFPFTLQANHVTPPEQVFIKCVSKGSNGQQLKATYNNVNNWAFQEALGETLITVCDAVPHGVLVFFSSYSVMDTVTKRWADNKMHDKMAQRKTIFRETRGSGDLNNMMREYRQCIKETSNGPIGEVDGAMLLAVFRGKVAEGIDFSDNEARAVVTIGIPYSVISDPAIDMKMRYNDENRKKNLLNGRAWYTCQAFRALNQALGRVIRHQNDWGAIVFVDARLMESSSVNLLPGWVRSMWSQQKNPNLDLATSLQNFVAAQKDREDRK